MCVCLRENVFLEERLVILPVEYKQKHYSDMLWPKLLSLTNEEILCCVFPFKPTPNIAKNVMSIIYICSNNEKHRWAFGFPVCVGKYVPTRKYWVAGLQSSFSYPYIDHFIFFSAPCFHQICSMPTLAYTCAQRQILLILLYTTKARLKPSTSTLWK